MKSSKWMISLILPVKNGSIALLERALSSVRAQTYKNYEILLTDDGSNETFAKKLDAIADKDPHIRLFHIAPSGVSSARNFAAGKAKGDIITYLDGDDALAPYCFEEAVSLFEATGADALWGGAYYVNEAEIGRLLSAPVRKAGSEAALVTLSVRLGAERIHKTRAECIGEPYRFSKRGYINRGIAGRFLKRSLFEEGGADFPSGVGFYEDAIWNLQMLSKNIYYVRSVWYYYYNNIASVSNRYNKHILKDIEAPVLKVRSMLDMENTTEYRAYTKFLLDSLRYVIKCFYAHPKSKTDIKTKCKLADHIYTHMPWSEIASTRFIRTVSGKDKVKALLYKCRLLLVFYRGVAHYATLTG